MTEASPPGPGRGIRARTEPVAGNYAPGSAALPMRRSHGSATLDPSEKGGAVHTWFGLDPTGMFLPALALALWLVVLAFYGLAVVAAAAESRPPR
jgi:hypothetical protein